MSVENNTEARITWPHAIIAFSVALAAGGFIVLLPYALVWLTTALNGAAPDADFTTYSGFNFSLTLLFPLVQGFAMRIAMGRPRYDGWTNAAMLVGLTLIEIIGAYVFLREGVICLIILSPLIIGLMAVGMVFGSAAVRRKHTRTLQVSLVPLLMLGVFAEAAGPRPEYASAVVDEVVVNAPPEYVWRYVVQYPENRSAPDYWLWQIGLPHPTQSVAEAPRVGAKRLCKFSTGIAFEERIVELEPNRVLTFEVTRQPDHPEVIGHFQFDRGQIRLTDNGDGTTTMTATSWYRLYVRPAAYFDLWTADITRHVHFRVLNHMKALAEADYRAER